MMPDWQCSRSIHHRLWLKSHPRNAQVLASIPSASYKELKDLRDLQLLPQMMAKVAIHRPRPATDSVDVFSQLSSYSFPSGHLMCFLGYFGFVWFLVFSLLKDSSKRTVLLVVLGLPLVLVGPSRIYLGAHWPSDILGAYLLGILVLVGIVRVYRWGKTRFFVHQPVAAAPAKA